MGGLVGALQAFGGDVGINLRGREAGVTEECLDAAEVGTVVEEVRGEAVAELVRGEVGRKPGLDEAGADHVPDRPRGKAGAGLVDEERAGVDARSLAVF